MGSRPLTAVTVGRLVDVKGYDMLLHAWCDVPVPLTIVGSGPLDRSLRKLAADLGVSGRVSFSGELDNVFDILESSDIYVSSSHREGFSYALLEACQAQCVVISTRTGIALDILPSEYLVPPNDEKALSASVNRAIDRFDNACMEFEETWRVAAGFTESRMVSQTVDVYQNLLSQH